MEFRRAILPPSLGSCTRSVKASLYWTQARWPLSSLSEQALGSLELLQACRDYFEKTGRRVSFEYTMIDGVSDSPEQAELLAKKLQGMAAHVNMIPLNSVEESGLRCSSRQAIAKFQEILERHGVTATVRRTLGSDINASCGQLRRKYELKQ